VTDHEPGLRLDIERALHARGEAIRVPDLAIGELVRIARRKARRRRAGVSLVAATSILIVVGAIAVTSTLPRDDDSAVTTAPSASTGGQDIKEPPRSGPAPELPYVSAGVLHQQRVATRIRNEGPFELTFGTGPVAVVRGLGTGGVTVYDRRGESVVELKHSEGLPVVSRDGHWFALIEMTPEPAVVRQSLTTAPGAEIDRLALPSAARAEVRLVGVDQLGRLFITAGDRTWVWDTRVGNEGVEPEAPGAEWVELELGGRVGHAVTFNKLVVQSSTAPEDFAIGSLQASHFAVEHSLRASNPDFAAESRAAFIDGDALVVQTWGEPPTALPLPQGFSPSGVTFESGGAYLVDGVFGHDRYWLRCGSKLDGCEVAAKLSPDDTLPR
jgi:hypothetical protein